MGSSWPLDHWGSPRFYVLIFRPILPLLLACPFKKFLQEFITCSYSLIFKGTSPLMFFRKLVNTLYKEMNGLEVLCPAPLAHWQDRVGEKRLQYVSFYTYRSIGEGNGTPLQYSCLENTMDGGAWWAAVHGVAKSWRRLSDFTFTFHFHALQKEMATHSSVLAWRIPGMGEPGGLPSRGSHRVRHNWSDLAAAAAVIRKCCCYCCLVAKLCLTLLWPHGL